MKWFQKVKEGVTGLFDRMSPYGHNRRLVWKEWNARQDSFGDVFRDPMRYRRERLNILEEVSEVQRKGVFEEGWFAGLTHEDFPGTECVLSNQVWFAGFRVDSKYAEAIINCRSAEEAEEINRRWDSFGELHFF